MSSNSFNCRSPSHQTKSDKKFCSVCYKKGLPESVYTTHFTKSAPGNKGIITCPTILNSQCTYCNGKGHWADEKFCAAMRNDAKLGHLSKRNQSTNFVTESITDMDVSSLDSLSSDAIDNNVHVKPPVAGISWASMASHAADSVSKPDSSSFSSSFVNLVERSSFIKNGIIGNDSSVYYNTVKRGPSIEEINAYRSLQERVEKSKNRISWVDPESDEEDDIVDDDQYDCDNVSSDGSWN